jgi:lysophospholipase L1-like esterase
MKLLHLFISNSNCLAHWRIALSLNLLFLSMVGFAQNPIDSSKTDGLRVNQIINGSSLNPFFENLHNSKTKPDNISILHMGDSHMQMGYFVGEMRRNFFEAFGSSSIGLLFPHPIVGYRPFYVKSESAAGQWKGGNYLRPETEWKYGVSGFTIQSKLKQASFTIRPNNLDQPIMTSREIVLYFQCKPSTKIKVRGYVQPSDPLDSVSPSKLVESNTISPVDSFSGWKKQRFGFEEPVSSLVVSIEQEADSLPFDLFAMQWLNPTQPGITYHNAGVGGSTFLSLCKNASLAVEQIVDLNPDLIIYSYGSNEAYTPTFKTDDYRRFISNHLDQIKNKLPNTTILLTSPPDTRSKDRYPRNIDTIRNVFQQLAEEKKLAYWDLRNQMGGDGSLHRWLKKGWASKDKLHFTKPGYELQAKLLTEAIFKAYNNLYPNEILVPTTNIIF